jgi:putative intracellular protease/amidase
LPDYAAHEAVYFSQAITADDFAMKKNPKYVNKVVAPTLEPISSIGGFRTLPDYSFDTMPDDYVALVLIGGFGWNTPVAEKVIGAICNAASFMAKCGIDRETTSKTLQKSSVIQKISVTLSSVIIAIIVCKLLIFNTLRLQQFFANHHFSGTYISSNSR